MSNLLNIFKQASKKLQISIVLLAIAFSAVFSVTAPTQVEAQGATGGEVMSSCALENIGWIACPVIRAAARASDFAFTFISQSFMQIEVSLLQGEAGTSRAWGITRNIANVLFVVFLLYVIYGILTGRGVSNASIKRMLPRFIVAAILVNFSFVLGQIAVDISNIAGSSIQSAMTSVAGNDNIIATPDGTLGGPVGSDGYVSNDGAIARVTSAILSNPNLAWVLLVPLISVVMSVGVITAVMIIVLIIRKVLIVALLLLAPIAFVLYLLPNTEHYFSRWLRMFSQLLLLFPVMAILLGAGQIVGSAVMSTTGDNYSVSGDQYQTANGNTVSATTSLVAIGATVLPLLGTWYAFRGAMQAMDTSVARLQGSGSKYSGGDPAKEAERLKRANQSIQRNSLMNRSSDRLKRVTDIQSESSGNVVGVAGNGVIRRRKKTEKTPQQQQFDQQVQARLGEIKQGVENGDISATPQQLYVQALQSSEDGSSSSGTGRNSGTVGVGSLDNVELKAAEAYLLESIGKSPESNSIDPNTFLKQQANQTQSSEQKRKEQQQAIMQAQENQANIPQPNQALQSPEQKQKEANRGKQAGDGQGVDEQSQNNERQDNGAAPSSVAAVQGGSQNTERDEPLGRPRTEKEKLQQLASGGAGASVEGGVANVNIIASNDSRILGQSSSRSREAGFSAANPAAINERIPSRLKPITDLEKKAQAIAAKHVASSQEKANGVETFEEELRLRAERASLNPMRMLEKRQVNKDKDRK